MRAPNHLSKSSRGPRMKRQLLTLALGMARLFGCICLLAPRHGLGMGNTPLPSRGLFSKFASRSRTSVARP